MFDFPESHFLDEIENVISFFTEDIDFELTEALLVENWIRQVIEQENCQLVNVSYIFVAISIYTN